MVKIEKIKPRQREVIQSTRQRLYRFALVILLAWCSLEFLPHLDHYPTSTPEKMEVFKPSQLGDISIFNLLEKEVEAKAHSIQNKANHSINIEEYISKLKIDLKNDYEKIYGSVIQNMETDILEHLANYFDRIFNTSTNANLLAQLLSWLLHQTASIVHHLLHSCPVEIARAVVDPTLPFLHAIFRNYHLDYLKSSEAREINKNFYIQTRLPEALEKEVKRTWNNLENIETQLNSIRNKYKTGKLNQKKVSTLNEQLNEEVDALIRNHQLRMSNDIILWINKTNDQLVLIEWDFGKLLSFKLPFNYTCPLSPLEVRTSKQFSTEDFNSQTPTSRVLPQCHSTISSSWNWMLLMFSQVLDRITLIFSHLIEDEFIIEILVIYFVFSLSIINSRFNGLKGQLFILLYKKATWTSKFMNDRPNNFLRAFDILNQLTSKMIIEIRHLDFPEFQKYRIKNTKEVSKIIKIYAKKEVHKFKESNNIFVGSEEEVNSIRTSISMFKKIIKLIVNILCQPFYQPLKILFCSKPSNPRSDFDKFFRDIRIFRNQILYLKMALQYPCFLYEHHSTEIAYDVIVDGLPPNLDQYFTQGEDAKRFTDQYKSLFRKVSSLNIQDLVIYLNQRSILSRNNYATPLMKERIFESRLNFITESLLGLTPLDSPEKEVQSSFDLNNSDYLDSHEEAKNDIYVESSETSEESNEFPENEEDIKRNIRHDIEVFAKQVNVLSELISIFEVHYECVNWAVKTNLLDLKKIGYRNSYSEFIKQKVNISLGFYIFTLLVAVCKLLESLAEKFEKETDDYYRSFGWNVLLEESEDVLDAKRSRIFNHYLAQGMTDTEATALTEKDIESLMKTAIKRNGKEYIPSKLIINDFETLQESILSTMHLPEDVTNALNNLFQLMSYLKLQPIHLGKGYQRIWGYCYINESVVLKSDLFNENLCATIHPCLMNFFVHIRPRVLTYKARREDVMATLVNFLLSSDMDTIFNHFNFLLVKNSESLENVKIFSLGQEIFSFLTLLQSVQLDSFQSEYRRDFTEDLRM
jgi:hypothetical protein